MRHNSVSQCFSNLASNPSVLAIHFYHTLQKLHLPKRQVLKRFILQNMYLLRPELRLVKLHYIFCDDAYLLSLNQKFLQHDTYTDIITFDLSTRKFLLEGEIYISIERVKENALLHRTSYEEELHRVIFHGALHLCGFRDKTKVERAQMREAEDSWLKDYHNLET